MSFTVALIEWITFKRCEQFLVHLSCLQSKEKRKDVNISRFGCSIGRCLPRLCKKSKKNGLRGKIFRKIEEKNVTEMLSSATMMNLSFSEIPG